MMHPDTDTLAALIASYRRAHADYEAAETALDIAADRLDRAADLLDARGVDVPTAWIAGDEVILLDTTGDGDFDLLCYQLAGVLPDSERATDPLDTSGYYDDPIAF